MLQEKENLLKKSDSSLLSKNIDIESLIKIIYGKSLDIAKSADIAEEKEGKSLLLYIKILVMLLKLQKDVSKDNKSTSINSYEDIIRSLK